MSDLMNVDFINVNKYWRIYFRFRSRVEEMEGWRTRTGCMGLGEDNARFLLLGFVLGVYMLAGALLFQQLEQDTEIEQAQRFWVVYNNFIENHLPSTPCSSYNGTRVVREVLPK